MVADIEGNFVLTVILLVLFYSFFLLLKEAAVFYLKSSAFDDQRRRDREQRAKVALVFFIVSNTIGGLVVINGSLAGMILGLVLAYVIGWRYVNKKDVFVTTIYQFLWLSLLAGYVVTKQHSTEALVAIAGLVIFLYFFASALFLVLSKK